MSLTISDVRLRIQDIPYCIPKPGEFPEIIGTSDGTVTIFQMSRIPYTGIALTAPPGITVYSNPGSGTVWSQVSSSLYTIQNGNQIVFNAPVAANTVIGVRYFYAVFQDTDLQSILNLAEANPVCNSDQITLYMCQYDIAGMLLMNRAQMINMRRSDIVDEVNEYASGLMKMISTLTPILFGAQRPGANIPFAMITEDFTTLGYSPQR